MSPIAFSRRLGLALSAWLLSAHAGANPVFIVAHGPDPSVVGQSIVVSTRIVRNAGTAEPTGVVTISDGIDSCSATLPQGYCLWTPSTPGARTLTASYPGDAFYSPSSDSAGHVVEDRQLPERVSLGQPFLSFDLSGVTAGGAGRNAALSVDGRYVAFISVVDLPGDANGYADAYLLDRHSGALNLISVDSAEAAANSHSSEVAISADGRYVAFTSGATNLVAGDTGLGSDVFLRDLVAGTTVCVSLTESGTEASSSSGEPDVSANGRRVVFKSVAPLTTSDTNGNDADVFLRDLDAGSTTLISINQSGGSTVSTTSHSPSISDDGNRVAFLSSSHDLVPGDANMGIADAFLRDLSGTPSTTRISVNNAGGQTNNPAFQLTLSPDGSKALFLTAGSLAPLDTNVRVDCYERDTMLGTTALITLKDDDSGPSANVPAEGCAYADNGGVYFMSTANDLVTGADEADSLDLFKRDRVAGTTTRITSGAIDQIFTPLLLASDNGEHAAFYTFESALVPGTINDLAIYSADTGGYSGLNVDRRGNQMDRPIPIFDASISADGRFVAFVADSRNLVADKVSSFPEVFVRDRQTGSTERMAVANDGRAANAPSYAPAISANGRYVAFVSGATNIAPGGGGVFPDVLVRDRDAGITRRVSVGPGGETADGDSSRAAISADGRYVAFESNATNLLGAGNDANGASDIFRWDRDAPLASAIVRVSVTDDENPTNGASDHVKLSADGNKVLFASQATNINVNGGPAGQIFLREIAAGTTVQVSLTEGGGPASTPSHGPRLSGDGSTAAFWSTSNGNIAPSIVGIDRLLRRDLATGSYSAVRDIGGQAITTAPNRYANLSADGRYLALVTNAALDPTQAGGTPDLYVYDFGSGNGRVVAGPNGNRPQAGAPTASALALSGDGMYLTTASAVSDLVTADTNGVIDQFVFANPAFAVDLEQQVDIVDVSANDDSLAPVSDASGDLVVFQSQASNLGGADANGALEDIFSVNTSTGATERLSTNNDGTPLTGAAMEPSVSGDGQVAVFVADDAGIGNVFGEPTKRTQQFAKAGGFSVLMRNRIANTTQRMAIPAQPGGVGTAPQLAPGGNALVYSAPNTNAALGQPGQIEVFKIPLDRVGNMLVPGAPQCVSCKARDAAGNATGNSDGDSRAPAVSADGHWVAWETTAKNLTPTPSPCVAASTQIMLRNMVTNTLQRIGVPASASDCGAAGTGARKPKIDWPGRKIVFESDQPLKPGDANNAPDIYLVNLGANQLTRVSETAGGGDASGASTEPTISGDGQVIGYVSAAANLDSEADTNGQPDVHVRNYRDALLATRRLSRTRSGSEADGASRRPAMNYNGTRLAFDSDASNLAPGAQVGVQHVFQRANPLTGEVVFSTGFE